MNKLEKAYNNILLACVYRSDTYIYIIYIHIITFNLDSKTITDQAYSCPRDWRLSASWGNLGCPP